MELAILKTCFILKTFTNHFGWYHTKPMFKEGVGFHYTRGNVKQEEALHYAHMCVAYAMISDENRGKLDENGTK